MLKEIHKFASVTSRPIAICGTRKHTETHTRIDKWGRATKDEHKMWNPRKTLMLHNSRETLA